jgi:hypothetical protein
MTRSASALLLALLFPIAPLAHAADDPAASITIPAGSDVELVNTRIVWMKSAQAGDTLYLQVNESLTVDHVAAIPAGTYVQATLLSLMTPLKKETEATLHLRFDKLIFPNGYTVMLAQPAPLARITVLVASDSDILLDNGQWLDMQLPAPLKLDAEQVMQASTHSRAPSVFKPGTLCRGVLAGSVAASKNSSSGPMPDLIIPGVAGTPNTTMSTGPTTSQTMPGLAGTPDQIIPSHPNFDDDDKPTICALPPSIRSSVPEIPQSTLQTPVAATLQSISPLLTVPSGAAVPLTLSQPVNRKSYKLSNAVSATVAFPVTVGGQIAIPAGTKVDGTVTEFKPSEKKTRQPNATIQWTHLVYPNGYTVTLDTPATAELTAPPVTFPIILSLFDTGWQFQMTTQSAFTVDAAKITAATVIH